MKRRWLARILVCLIFLAGGAITTVAVAWGAILLCEPPRMGLEASLPSTTEWPRAVPLTWSPPTTQRQGRSFAIRRRIFHHRVDWQYREVEFRGGSSGPPRAPGEPVRAVIPTEELATSLTLADVGWPVASLQMEYRVETQWSGWTAEESWFPAWELPDNLWELGLDRPRWALGRVPLRPLWPGFLIDSLFYAAIWFGVFLAPGMAKRAIRRKRGRCPRCGYDLRGELAGGCPECGWGRETAKE
jgi:hypothetical protein